MSWDDPPHPTSQKKLPGGQPDQGHEVVHHDQEEGYQQPNWDQISTFLLFEESLLLTKVYFWQSDKMFHGLSVIQSSLTIHYFPTFPYKVEVDIKSLQ